MQQTRKPMPTRQRMTAAKSARSRGSAEQMLVELKRRLREISDLTAAGDVLNWDQGVPTPEAAVNARYLPSGAGALENIGTTAVPGKALRRSRHRR
jgi:hypothetical protein